MFVNSGAGYVEVTTPGINWPAGGEVLNECYTGLVGVQVTNSVTNAWGGSIESSTDGKATYSPMECQDCDTGIITEYIVVDGDGNGQGDTTCLNGNVCTLNVAPPPAPTISPTTDSPTLSSAPTGTYDKFYQAEATTGVEISDGTLRSDLSGFTGTGWIDMGENGSYIKFFEVDGGPSDGPCAFRFRYSLIDSKSMRIRMNGSILISSFPFESTGDKSTWTYSPWIESTCESNIDPTTGGVRYNRIRLEANTSDGGINVDGLDFKLGAP